MEVEINHQYEEIGRYEIAGREVVAYYFSRPGYQGVYLYYPGAMKSQKFGGEEQDLPRAVEAAAKEEIPTHGKWGKFSYGVDYAPDLLDPIPVICRIGTKWYENLRYKADYSPKKYND